MSKLRKLLLAGVGVATAATIAACGSPASPQADPVWAGATQGPDSPSPTPSTATATTKAAAAAQAKVQATPTPTKAKVTYTFPVIGKNSYAHTHHDYPATDVITKCGNRFVAVTGGVVLAVSRKDTWSPKVNAGATRGGLSVSILGDDGVRYYGSHLSAIDKAISVGVRVKTGQTLGKTGDTGDASACHLHFGISPPCAKQGDWWNQRGTVYPWPFLDSWKKGGQKSPVATVAAWHKKNGCPTKPTVDK